MKPIRRLQIWNLKREIKAAESDTPGLRIKLKDKDLEIDLTDNAIANVLLRYLLPRYRAIVAGEE